MNYDLNGNLVCISGPVACAARGDDFIYSAENQLLRAWGPDADYSYDPAARRVRKDVAGVVTDFLHAGDMEIAEYGASGTLLRRYIPGPGVDQRIAMIECGAGGGAAACAPGGAGVATRYYFADRQGNVLALANQDGTLAQQFFYTPFGVELVGNAGENPFRYTGRRFDPETGLYYYRARYYDADLGRFLQVDPVGYADQWNLYAYVGNNPLNATDPSGMQSIDMVGVEHYLRAIAIVESDGVSYAEASQSVNRVDQKQYPVILGGSLAITGLASGAAGVASSGPLVGGTIAMGEFGGSVGTGDIAEVGGATRGPSTLSRNTTQGILGEGMTRARLGDRIAGEQVTFRTSRGTTARPDFVTSDGVVVETKTGGAGLSSGQRDLFDDIENGVPVEPRGANARNSGLEPGRPVVMRGCEIDRPC